MALAIFTENVSSSSLTVSPLTVNLIFAVF
jgi:hypothetical protein